MSKLTPEQFARVESLFFEAGQKPEHERGAFLVAECDDPLVRGEVESLLKHGNPSGYSSMSLMGDLPSAGGPTRLSFQALVGKTVGAYQIRSILGHGGMGVVYLASDTRLGRDVAVKSLPPAFTDHPTRMARFMREARLLASLSHSNIATVFGLEESGSARLLVMELVDGETLSARISRGALPIAEALAVCRQIADGVEAAHEAGVIHRDLKPGNVMLTAEGKVKVLDFGLARDVTSNPAGATEPLATPTAAHTREGSILGTPGYMSPEQVRGRNVDKRADIFSFGCILYECLTGRVAFAGATQADVIASVLERDPDWSLLPAGTPPRIRRLLVRCTAKDLSERLHDIGDARFEIEDALEEKAWLHEAARPAAAPLVRRSPFRQLASLLPWALVAGLIGLVLMLANRPEPAGDAPIASAPAPLYRFTVPFPNNQPQTDLSHLRLALSRDGSKLAVSVNDGQSQDLWLRQRGDTEFHRVPGTRDAWIPSFSTDGQWLVYYERGVMKKCLTTGGGAVKIIDNPGYWGTYFWSNDQMINYVPLWGKGVARVSAEGGKYTMVTKPDYDRGEYAQITPIATADSSHLLYGAWDGKKKTRIDAFHLASGEKHTVVENGSTPRIARTPGGQYLLYARGGTIYAAPLDPKSVTLSGPERAVADGVMTDEVWFTACYDVADDGTLAYVPGPSFVEQSRLAWLDLKTGATAPINDDRLSFVEPHFSADGTRLSVLLKGDVYRPVIYDMASLLFSPVLLDGDTASASISPSGTMFAYSNNREGPYTLYLRNLTDRSEERLFNPTGDYQVPIAWSPDERYILFSYAPDDSGENRDIAYIDLSDKSMHAFCDSPAEERSPAVSPNGKWVAFASNQTGTREIYVRSFPDGKLTRQVSFGGGDAPAWSPESSDSDSDTLYFRASGLYAVKMSKSDGTVIDRPTLVYDKPFGQSDDDMPDYTVAPDGRLLIIEPSERGPAVSHIRMLLNWHSLLSENAPGN